ncbi:hypothetical protein D9756_004497 [Leucocoprinus leucothites]|uniref:Uncharacterized protein n=1 Tax=Leucocoprinus leucothites TaxID=201217 RepID=A0A8H5G916_9AGAR|nr:hypothetical protein D9756_004497 [Leucoagaricus leucothites]
MALISTTPVANSVGQSPAITPSQVNPEGSNTTSGTAMASQPQPTAEANFEEQLSHLISETFNYDADEANALFDGDVNMGIQDTTNGSKCLEGPNLKAKQSDIEKQLIKIVSSPEPYPTPGHTFQNLVGKCLVEVYMRAEKRTMFDVLQAFMKVTGDFKAPVGRDGSKIAALSCVGDVMAMFGANVMSFMVEIATVTLKTMKSSNIHDLVSAPFALLMALSTLLRYQALVTLEKSVSTAKRAFTDTTTKDIFKQCRNYLMDKAMLVQHAATNVIIVMYSHNDGTHPSTSKVEAILNLCIKSLNMADQLTQCTLAQLVGHLLASTQVERAIPVPEPAQKPKKDQENANDNAIAPSQAAKVKKAQLLPTKIPLLLSNSFNKPHQSRKIHPSSLLSYCMLYCLPAQQCTLLHQWIPNNTNLYPMSNVNESSPFENLGLSSIAESTQVLLLQLTISVCAGPEAYRGTGLAVQAAIASLVGTFMSVWVMTGGYRYSVMSNEIIDFGGIGTGVNGDVERGKVGGRRDYLNRDDVEVSIDTLVLEFVTSPKFDKSISSKSAEAHSQEPA